MARVTKPPDGVRKCAGCGLLLVSPDERRKQPVWEVADGSFRHERCVVWQREGFPFEGELRQLVALNSALSAVQPPVAAASRWLFAARLSWPARAAWVVRDWRRQRRVIETELERLRAIGGVE